MRDELQRLKDLTEKERKSKNEDVKEMIRHYIQLTHHLEDRRVRTFTSSLTVMSISAGILMFGLANKGIVGRQPEWYWVLTFTRMASATLLIAALFCVLRYYRQCKFRIPFLDAEHTDGPWQYGNTWKWFYYGNKDIQRISTNTAMLRFRWVKRDFFRHYLKGLVFFVKKYSEESLDEELADNLVQLYLFQVHNYYKNKFNLELVSIWHIAFFMVILAALSCCVAWHFVG